MVVPLWIANLSFSGVNITFSAHKITKPSCDVSLTVMVEPLHKEHPRTPLLSRFCLLSQLHRDVYIHRPPLKWGHLLNHDDSCFSMDVHSGLKGSESIVATSGVRIIITFLSAINSHTCMTRPYVQLSRLRTISLHRLKLVAKYEWFDVHV